MAYSSCGDSNEAFKFSDDIGLVFTKILDEMQLGLVDEDEEREVQQISTNREFWVKKTSNETVQLTDKFLEIINEPEWQLPVHLYKK